MNVKRVYGLICEDESAFENYKYKRGMGSSRAEWNFEAGGRVTFALLVDPNIGLRFMNEFRIGSRVEFQSVFVGIA